MITYWLDYHERLTSALWQHLRLVSISLAIAFALAILIVALFSTKTKWLTSFIYFFSALYAIQVMLFLPY